LIQTEMEKPERAHLARFLEEWDRLQAIIEIRD